MSLKEIEFDFMIQKEMSSYFTNTNDLILNQFKLLGDQIKYFQREMKKNFENLEMSCSDIRKRLNNLEIKLDNFGQIENKEEN